MKKFIVSCVLLLLLPFYAYTVEISVKDRASNRPPGYCAWSSIETLGRYHHVKALFNLVDNRSNDPDEWAKDENGNWFLKLRSEGWDDTICAKLSTLKVNYEHRSQGSYDRSLLKYANELGVAVGMKLGAFKNLTTYHEIVLTWYDENTVKFIDSNNIDYNYKGSREWFDYFWDGSSILIKEK